MTGSKIDHPLIFASPTLTVSHIKNLESFRQFQIMSKISLAKLSPVYIQARSIQTQISCSEKTQAFSLKILIWAQWDLNP